MVFWLKLEREIYLWIIWYLFGRTSSSSSRTPNPNLSKPLDENNETHQATPRGVRYHRQTIWSSPSLLLLLHIGCCYCWCCRLVAVTVADCLMLLLRIGCCCCSGWVAVANSDYLMWPLRIGCCCCCGLVAVAVADGLLLRIGWCCVLVDVAVAVAYWLLLL